jgi:hypothetical protein
MRNGILASTLTLLSLGGLALAEPPQEGPLSNLPRQPITLAYDDSGLPAGPSAPGHIKTPDSCPGPGSCDLGGPGCGICGPPGRVWVSAEYLLWWIKDSHLPPLVTAGPPGSTGVIGSPGTTVIFGGSDLDHEVFSGGRFSAGFWLNSCQTLGLETDYFFLGSRSTNFVAGGPGNSSGPTVARPIIDVLANGGAGAETAELVSFAGTVAGVVNVAENSRLWGAQENLLANLCCSCCGRVDLIAGFRYLELDEGLTITENLAVEPGVPAIGGSFIGVADQFSTHDRFYGGQLGARAEYWRGNAFVNVTGLVALGDTHQVVGINGTTVIAAPGMAPVALRGGILALPSNSGHFHRDDFSVVPEIGLNVGYQVLPHVRVFMGYTFLYWSDVVRPGDQIDRGVNLTQLPSNLTPGTLVGPARPAVLFKDTDFWAQGINFGIEFRF